VAYQAVVPLTDLNASFGRQRAVVDKTSHRHTLGDLLVKPAGLCLLLPALAPLGRSLTRLCRRRRRAPFDRQSEPNGRVVDIRTMILKFVGKRREGLCGHQRGVDRSRSRV